MKDDFATKWKGIMGSFRTASEWTWIAAGAVALLILMITSVTDIEPGEIAIKVNNLTGSETVVTRPGWTTRVPMLHSVYIIDARPQTFSMKNQANYDELHVEELSVRASDGSNFHFTDTTILFQLIPDQGVRAVRSSGLGEGYLQWMKPYARSVLRDEFGRESTIDVSNPTTYGEAANRAKDRLNELLATRGLRVTQLVTPRPRFSEDYEQAIEERNALGNELEVIRSNLDRAETNRQRMLAEVDQEQNQVIQQRRASLESDLSRALAEQAEARRGADSFQIEQIARGQAALSAATHQARELQGELAARYRAQQAEIQAFQQQPVARLMERLGEKLAGVTIAIQPWAEDATPSRIRVEQAAGRGGN
jgi:membrane protease subunit HflC